jgi:hypothetical protein
MLRCSRFLPALAAAFLYALVAPLSILVRMGGSGWHWVWNDPAFGFFMVAIFPFAVAVFSCVVRIDLLEKATTSFSRLAIPILVFVAMLGLLIPGVRVDFKDPTRMRQPYMLQDPVKVQQLSILHDQILGNKDFVERRETREQKRQEYSQSVKGLPISYSMEAIFITSNFINVGFAIAVFCYILLLGVAPEQIEEKTCNHLVFVLAALAVWFPCRAYADWYMNLLDTSWVNTYQAAWILAALLIVACFVLALKMVSGSLYHRFVIPIGATSAILCALAALKPQLLTQAALDISSFSPVFRIALVIIVVALLFYVSSSIHQSQRG